MTLQKTYPWILIISGIVGILMSFLLTLDKIELLSNPAAELPCNINPIVSCGPVINTPQASAFGVPNPLVGLIGYSFVLMIGILLQFDVVLPRKFWLLFMIGITFNILFIHYLISQSIFVIGALCIYCMITWAFTWPLFLYSLINYFKLKGENFITRNHLPIFISWYLLILFLILFHFRAFFFN